MLLVPFHRVTIRSQLSEAEVRRRVGHLLDTDDFEGRERTDGFQMIRCVDYRNSFVPVLTGRITPTGTETHIAVVLRPHMSVLAFLCVWLSVVTIVVVAQHAAVATGLESYQFTKLLPGYILLGFTAVMPVRAFAREVRSSLDLLATAVEGK